MTPEFKPFPKIPRWSREIVITEKLDGTNGLIHITEDGDIFAGSRNRWITPTDDNHGFAKWVEGNKEALLQLGPGRHFGEWWGLGIQRGYGLKEKRFSLFNTGRWNPGNVPPGVHVVPVLSTCLLWEGDEVQSALDFLVKSGSEAAPGFMNPEGIIIYHTAANMYFKKTIHKDEERKGSNDS
jgi:hypothetical protein